MSKALTVLAECVDARSDKRFQPGDIFDPAPTPVQAERLIKAGCLPQGALDAAKVAADEADKKADADSKKAAALVAAREKLANAKKLAQVAQAAVVRATVDKKADAEKALAEAKDAEKTASDAVTELLK